MKILVVDDSAAFRKVVRSTLTSIGATVVECSDGDEAVEAYRSHQPDWVLMDVEMSRMDGITATRSLKGTFPQARIIILTNYGDPALVDSAREAGATEYVPKERLSLIPALLQSSAD